MTSLLKDEFMCELRGTVAVKGKGKGDMQTWCLVGRLPDYPGTAGLKGAGSPPPEQQATNLVTQLQDNVDADAATLRVSYSPAGD